MSANKLPAGLELIFDLERAGVRNSLDAFILSLHWSVIRAGLRLRSETNPEDFTERLPRNWSGSTPLDGPLRHVTFDYFDPEKPHIKYQLRVVELTSNNQVVTTIFRSNTNDESTTTSADTAAPTGSPSPRDSSASTFLIGDFIRSSLFSGPPEALNRVADVFYNAADLELQIWAELMEPLNLKVLGQPPLPGPYDSAVPPPTSSAKQNNSTNQRQQREPRSSLIDTRFSPRRPLQVDPMGGIGGIGGRIGPPVGGLGRSDLDPLGGIGAGMLADPRGLRIPRAGPPGMFPGAQPPNARFDPYGPPNPSRPQAGTGRWANPDPDHEQPPPGFDDMFM